MWILCLAEDSQEISSLIFSEKKYEKVYMNEYFRLNMVQKQTAPSLFLIHSGQ